MLHVIDRSHPGLLWPALVEKAYLKVRGGYDFPGSNSGTDVAVLTGWIPQQVFLHDEEVEPEEMWEQLYKAFQNGDNLLTIGTGRLPRREQKQLGLAAEHDYAVLELKYEHGYKEMLIKNPWADGDVWKGTSRRKPNTNQSAVGGNASRDDQATEGMIPGTFWMDFNSVFQHFENMYINWDPGLFSFREDWHLSWQLGPSSQFPKIFTENPQFLIQSSKTGEVWLLLNRHFRTGDYTSTNSGRNGYISLYLFTKDGRRVLSSEGAAVRGPFVDSPNTLLRFTMPAKTAYTAVVASQDLPPGKHNFTLSVFSHSPTVLASAESKYGSSTSIPAAWTRSTAGGNSDSPSYLSNPQFTLSIPFDQSAAFVLRLDESNLNPAMLKDIHVKVIIVFSDGRRITRLRSRDIIAHSGDYRRGSAVLETKLQKGNYTIICSTFETNQLAKFVLDLYSSAQEPPPFTALPSESSGRLSILSAPAVFSDDVNRLLVPVTIPRTTQAIVIARTVGSLGTTSSLFKMTLEDGQGPYKTCVASSVMEGDEEYQSTIRGLRIENLTLPPTRGKDGGLWLVLERLPQGSSKASNEALQVEILADERVQLGEWGVGSG